MGWPNQTHKEAKMFKTQEFRNGGGAVGVQGPTPMAPMPKALKDLLDKQES